MVNSVQKQPRPTTISSISTLFYSSCVLGIVPYSLSAYAGSKIFKISIIGNIWSLLILIHNCAQYHFAQLIFSLGEERQTGTLTVAIGIFIIYMEPFMMIVDIIAGMINQKSLIQCFDRLQKVDDKLLKDNQIEIDYKKLNQVSTFICIAVILAEIAMNITNLLLFLEFNIFSLWSLITVLPILTNSVARIWFFILVFSVRERFRAINDYFVKTRDLFVENKRKYQLKNDVIDRETESIGYLGEEIFSRKNVVNFMNKRNNTYSSESSRKGGKGIIQVIPIVENDMKKGVSVLSDASITNQPIEFNEKEFLIGEKMDKKLIMLCRLHDEICEIGKLVNKMYSFQMLITMAFGFMSITAQFYFLYCGLASQGIPKLFRSAESVPNTIVYIGYTALKCVSIIYISYKTKTDAQKTGIQLHKIANVVDENHFYHVINHLSLKLLNHQLNFTACGFFDLDMTTVYAITGAITSYLIILIQFNIASQRPKKEGDNSTTTTMKAIMTSMMPTLSPTNNSINILQ